MVAFMIGFVLATSAAGADGALLAASEEMHTGKIVSAGDGKLLIVDDNGENQEFTVSEKTKITRNEKTADLDDLEEGDLVKIKSQRKGTEFVALSITATSPE